MKHERAIKLINSITQDDNFRGLDKRRDEALQMAVDALNAEKERLNTFASTHWSDDDIKEALEQNDQKVTKRKINKVRELAEKNILNAMVSAGWEVIETVINEEL